MCDITDILSGVMQVSSAGHPLTLCALSDTISGFSAAWSSARLGLAVPLGEGHLGSPIASEPSPVGLHRRDTLPGRKWAAKCSWPLPEIG